MLEDFEAIERMYINGWITRETFNKAIVVLLGRIGVTAKLPTEKV